MSILSKRIIKNTIIYSIKQISAILFPLITFAYASRVLGVDGIGKVNYINSIATYFVVLSGLGISTYAIRNGSQIRDNKELINKFVSELFVINIISTILSMCIYISIFFIIPNMEKYYYLFFCFLLLIPFTTLGIEWVYNIFEDFSYITIKTIIFQILSLFLLFIFVKESNDYIIYAYIIVLSSVCSNLMNIIYARKYIRFTIKGLLIRKHVKPIFYLFGMTIATTIYTTMDTTMIGILSNDFEVGLYSAAHKVIKMLIFMIATVRTVSLPILSRKSNNNEKEYISISNNILNIITTITIPIAIGVITYADIILFLLSGNKYSSAVPVLKILGVDIFFSALSGMFVYQYVLLKRGEKTTFLITLIGALINLVLNYYFIINYKALGAAIATCISELVVTNLSFIYSKKYINLKNFFRKIFVSIVSSIIIIFSKIVVCTVFDNIVIINIIAIVLCIIIYFTTLYLLGDNDVNMVIKYFREFNKNNKKENSSGRKQ